MPKEYIENLSAQDINAFIIALDNLLCIKCNYGESAEKLSGAEKVFYFNQTLEKEVNNGGYSQFFFNSSGNFTYEILASLREVNANKTSEIHKKAIDAFGCEIPKDWDKRQELMIDIPDEVKSILSECDNEFYKYQDNLNELNYQFVQKNNIADFENLLKTENGEIDGKIYEAILEAQDASFEAVTKGTDYELMTKKAHKVLARVETEGFATSLLTDKGNTYVACCNSHCSEELCDDFQVLNDMTAIGDSRIVKMVTAFRQSEQLGIERPCARLCQFIFDMNSDNFNTEVMMNNGKTRPLKDFLPSLEIQRIQARDAFELRIMSLHWITGADDDPCDPCLHGQVFIRIGKEVIHDGIAPDIPPGYMCPDALTVSAGAYRILESLYSDHISGGGEQLMPHCGSLLGVDTTTGKLVICSCPVGFDWSVLHENGMVKLVTNANTQVIMPLDRYKEIVFSFADSVKQFYDKCSPKIFPDDFGRNSYDIFWSDWKKLRHGNDET